VSGYSVSEGTDELDLFVTLYSEGDVVEPPPDGRDVATGLPQEFVVGEPLQPRSELVLPVPLELVEQQLVPRDVGHGRRTYADEGRQSRLSSP
jgi:hypothetical protein